MKREDKGYILKDGDKWQLGFVYELEDGELAFMEYDKYDTYGAAWADMVAVQMGLK